MDDNAIICCVQDVHVRELITRVGWAVRVRWVFVAGCAGAAVGALLPIAPPGMHVMDFIGVGLFLAAVNLIFQRQARTAELRCVGMIELRRYCFVQVLADYLALAAVVYVLGGVETPVMFMVVLNVVVAALFFQRVQSLLISLMGLGLVLSPLLLVAVGLLAPRPLFADPLADRVAGNWYYVSAYLVTLLATVLVCWYIVSTITARLIHNELELEQSNENLLRLDEEKTRATLRGTHELKAPLAAIKNYVYVLEAGYAGSLPPKAAEIIARIGRRCDRLLAKITDIMRLSNLRTYVYTGTQYQALDLDQALTEVVREAADLGQARGIRIEYQNCAAEPAIVRATHEHLHTLFMNLLSNAVNYSHDKGTVRVRLSLKPRSVIVDVADQGIGIAKEALPKIFDEYHRTRAAAAHHEGGTGLGLAIVKATVRLLGARIDVQSAEGAGSVFTVEFPRPAAGGS